MKQNLIKTKTFKFALSTIKVYKALTADKKEYVLSKQLLRSGTSIGAMVHESEHAESKPDFVHKLAIAQKGANESDYWLQLLFQSNYVDYATFLILHEEISEIKKILSSIIITAKQRMSKL